MKDIIELKPCPFCGGKAHIKIIDHDSLGKESYKVIISCGNWKCDVKREFYWFNTEKQAIEVSAEIWNNRVNKKPRSSKSKDDQLNKEDCTITLLINEWIDCHRIHANELIKCAETEYGAGYSAGKSTMISEIKGILEDCSQTNGIMIVSALQDLIEKYGEKNVR